MIFLHCCDSAFSSWCPSTLRLWVTSCSRVDTEPMIQNHYGASDRIWIELCTGRTAVTFSAFCSCVSFLWLYGYSCLEHTSSVLSKIHQEFICTEVHKSVVELSYFIASDYRLALSERKSFRLECYLNQFPERNFLRDISGCCDVSITLGLISSSLRSSFTPLQQHRLTNALHPHV